jgi:peptidoglycan hydrolase-like protein with peptidoglycan-binding domain
MTTVRGVDYAFDLPSTAALKAAGIAYAMRYVSADPSKNLTTSERDGLHAVGIGIGLVWETTGVSPLAGYAQGLAEAGTARAQASALGFPAGLPIYFAVDLDATTGQIGSVLDYLHGASDAEGSKALVGVYGDYEVIEAAHAAGYDYLWQTYAWSSGQWAPAYTIRQVLNGTTLGGVDVDLDEAASTAGLWMPSPPAPAPSAAAAGRPTVSFGESGYWVEVLQRSLMLGGQDPKGVDARFGPDTLAAVKAYQKAAALLVDGIVGEHTWGALVARTLVVQRALAAEHLGAGGTDSVAGPLTAQEVSAFQRESRLLVDGIVGPRTSAKLKIHP